MASRRAGDPDVLHREARVGVLSDLAAGQDDVFELLGTPARYDVRYHFTPDVALSPARTLDQPTVGRPLSAKRSHTTPAPKTP